MILDRVGRDAIGIHPTLPKPLNLAPQANYKQRKTRPEDPRDLAFEMDMAHVHADFLQGDIRVDQARHIILATPTMVSLLSRACTWYVYIDSF